MGIVFVFLVFILFTFVAIIIFAYSSLKGNLSDSTQSEEIYNRLINNNDSFNFSKHIFTNDDTNYCTDPRYNFLSCNIFHDNGSLSSSSDICTDPAYSFLGCNIFHNDSYTSSSWNSFSSWDSFSSWNNWDSSSSWSSGDSFSSWTDSFSSSSS